MATRPDLLGSTVSFAHLHGIARPPVAAKADDKKDDEKDNDEDTRAKAEGDDNVDEDNEDKKEDDKNAKADDNDENMKAEGEEDDDAADDDEDKKTKKAAHRGGVKAERARWAGVLGHKLFASNPALGARLLATTSLPAKAILACIRDLPAASGQTSSRAAGNPSLGPNGGAAPSTGAAANDQRWAAAFKRAGVSK
jgi:hypothetical protein